MGRTAGDDGVAIGHAGQGSALASGLVVAAVDTRMRRLGSPLFVGSVLLLVVNDHLLKGWAPGWFTGKASDVAGVVLVGTVLSVAVGRQIGVAVTALLWVALKTVPGVAEAAAPALGGPTLRDPSDLLALPGLLLVWWSFADQAEPIAPQAATGRPRALLAGSPVLLVLTCATAVFGTTATSCSSPSSVVRVVHRDDAFYADVSTGFSLPRWAKSADRGQTWTEATAPAGVPPDPDPWKRSNTPFGPTESCTDDGVCLRLQPDGSIQRVSGSGATTEYTPAPGELKSGQPHCAYPANGSLTSIAVAPDHADAAVASFGSNGVLARQQDGSWARRTVLDVPRPKPSPLEGPAELVLLIAGPAGAVFVLLYGNRRRWARCQKATVLVLVGWLGAVSLSLIPSMLGPTGTEPWGRAALALWLVGFGGCVLIARSSPRPRPHATLPPPPVDHSGS